MKYIKKLTPFILLLSITQCSISHPMVRDISSDVLPTIEKTHSTQASYNVDILKLEDKRPLNETDNLDNENLQYCVPTILWNQWAFSGSIYGNPKYYDANLTTNLFNVINKTIDKSGITSLREAKYDVKPTLLHYYGVSYKKTRVVFSPFSGGGVEKFKFFPTGYVSINFEIYEKGTSKLIGSKTVNGTYLLSNLNFYASVNGKSFASTNIEDLSSFCASEALKRLMNKVPYTVDQIISSYENNKNEADIKTFQIVRLTTDYDFEETIKIEYETGRIVSDKIELRKLPVISKPDEWIVAPINSDGHYIGPKQYKEFIKKLQVKYPGVSYSNNLTVANFYRNFTK